MKETIMYQITETSPYMMSFVIITSNDNVIIIDGGRAEDMKLLKEYIGKRHISAWILTHAHVDHISGFVHEFKQNKGQDFDIEKIYYHFPAIDSVNNHDVRDYDYYKSELMSMLPSFNEVLPIFEDKTHIVRQGESITR